jgi:hypothetical protein
MIADCLPIAALSQIFSYSYHSCTSDPAGI